MTTTRVGLNGSVFTPNSNHCGNICMLSNNYYCTVYIADMCAKINFITEPQHYVSGLINNGNKCFATCVVSSKISVFPKTVA